MALTQQKDHEGAVTPLLLNCIVKRKKGIVTRSISNTNAVCYLYRVHINNILPVHEQATSELEHFKYRVECVRIRCTSQNRVLL